MNDRPIIAGIDPGTTTAVAIMDIEGNLITIESGKGFSMPRITEFILEHGKPVIIASDKDPPPRALKRISASLSSRLMSPEENLSRQDKARIAKGFKDAYRVSWDNQHEKDALVAVLLAWKGISHLMERVDARIDKLKARGHPEGIRDFVKEGVLLRRRSIDYLIKLFMKINKG